LAQGLLLYIKEMKIILLSLIFLFSTEFSFAEIYKWVDDRGIVHFTDDFTQVPEKNRTKVERLGTSEERVDTKNENESLSKRKVGETRPREEPYRDRTGKGEAYWKGRVEESSKRLKDAQEKVNNLRVKYNDLTEKFNESKNSAERMNLRKERDQIKNEIERYKAEIEEAKNILDKKIPEEAEMFKAKPEWIKQ
jgi:hypothetical protein